MTLDLPNTQWILSHGPWTISLQFIHVPFCQNPSTGHSLDFSPVLESSLHVIKSLDSESGRGSLEYSVGASLRPTPQMVSSFARSILLCARIHVMLDLWDMTKWWHCPLATPTPTSNTHTRTHTSSGRLDGLLEFIQVSESDLVFSQLLGQLPRVNIVRLTQ